MRVRTLEVLLPRQRKILRGLSCDSFYLGERVFWQHAYGAGPCAPKNPPPHMLKPSRLSPDQFARWRAGEDATGLIIAGEAYSSFVQRKLRTPQAERRDGIPDTPVPRSDFTYATQDGERRRVFVPVAEQAPPGYIFDPHVPVLGRTADLLMRNLIGMKRYMKKFVQSMSCGSSSRAPPVYTPMPSRRSVDVPPTSPREREPSRPSMDVPSTSGTGPSSRQPFSSSEGLSLG